MRAAVLSLLSLLVNFWYHASSSGAMLGPIRSIAASKSRFETSVVSMFFRKAFMAASLQIASISAPE